MESFAVLGIQFEHLTHFDAPGFLQVPFTVGAFVSGHSGADVRHLGIYEIPGGFRIHIVDILFVGPAAHIVHVHHGLVDEDDGLVFIKADGPHESRHRASFPDQIIGSHIHFVAAHGIHHFGIVDFLVPPDKAQHQFPFVGDKGHGLHAFFHRSLQEMAYRFDGIAARGLLLF